MSACAGPARPRTAAARPLATMVANPNFFIVMPSSLSCRSAGLVFFVPV
jgi:hypothetical protein